jgi:predicted transcriptional regulator
MASENTITIHVSAATDEKLDRLASGTQRSKSHLAEAALADYVDRELEIVEGIKRGLADVEAGRVVPHDEAMAEIYAAIEAVQKARA